MHKSTSTFFCTITAHTGRTLYAAACMALCASLNLSHAKLPGELPGQEISDDQYFDYVIPRDSISRNVPLSSPSSPTWLDSAAATWDAPPIAQQIAEDEQKLLMGMGAIFVPRMGEAEQEPDIEILDERGEVVERGKPGRKYSLMAGSYYVMLGSGTHQQQIVKKVDVQEGKIIPLVPDWCTLEINVVDENNIPFRGEYELVRIDEFEPFGRGYGRNPDLGEELRTWVLRPGIYKILGVGQSYNALTNFVTVRLLPGEYTRFLLVQDEDDYTIKGGGTIYQEVDRMLASNWRYGLDIGGSIAFNAMNDRIDTTKTESQITGTLLSRALLKYEKNRVEWETRLLVDEWLDYFRKTRRLSSASDEVLMQSLFTWRMLKWLGPYGRAEVETGLVPQYARKPVDKDRYYFIFLDPDSTFRRIDATKSSYRLEPSFSPFSFEAGLGANASIINNRIIESRLLMGFGYRQETQWQTMQEVDTAAIDSADRDATTTNGAAVRAILDNNDPDDYTTIIDWGTTITRPEFGPELAHTARLRIGQWATAESELKLFIPVQRINNVDFKPDFNWRATLSWRVLRAITIDYQYEYELRWPEEIELRDNLSRHRVLIRFSYSSR